MAKRTYVVYWTWGNSEIVPTKKVGTERLKAWKEEKESQGWTTRSSRGGDPGYVAYAPDYASVDYNVFGPDAKLQVCLIYTYDTETKQRILPKPPDLVDAALRPYGHSETKVKQPRRYHGKDPHS